MNINVDLKAKQPASNGPTEETVIAVTHYTDFLFSFRITRPSGFKFRSGEFVMMGLQVNGKPLLRAYSIASPNWDDELEFFSIKVPDGPLTSRLQKINPGDKVLLGRKPVGTLVHDALKPGENLYLFSTGTGFAPFASIIRDPETYEKFNKVIVTHTCREAIELDYSKQVVGSVIEHEYLGELANGKLYYFDSVTREQYFRNGRITSFIENGELFQMLGLNGLNPQTDRAMICGSNQMIADTKTLLAAAGLTEGSNAAPAEFVVEKAFVG
ncbi:ferredoxin--NADP reductase [Kordiimonas sp. SCSIO 12610]|uniref:ferredoxin--NADP reductase n=1 Tax=Kordiimonas sp. SCSIO 12610 TaxID=2829597 RepID=UPI00210DEDBC|nr:ferredoxin--NADP reductase [Kordiimonas sp. SCSIO 12610]UTW54371.1 ferredoxin--NADP reductase [Kordiimonas sp. SCSIO 12610]